jgi:VCBS repeat-containing protein
VDLHNNDPAVLSQAQATAALSQNQLLSQINTIGQANLQTIDSISLSVEHFANTITSQISYSANLIANGQTNHVPEIFVSAPNALIEANTIDPGISQSQAMVTLHDSDTGDSAHYLTVNWQKVVGSSTLYTHERQYGSVTLDTQSGLLQYPPDNTRADQLIGGEHVVDTFTISAQDLTGAISNKLINFNITGTNDAAVLSSATVDLTQSDLPLTASGQLTISDIDSAQAFVANTIKGQYGSLTIDPAGKWAYQANSAHPEFAQDQNYNQIFTVKAIDGTATSVAINITGTNDAAVLSSATVDLTQSDLPLTASGQLTISDIDSAQAFVANTIKGQYGSLTIDPAGKWAYQANSAHPEFAQDQNFNEIFTVKAIDGTATSVAINITGTNDAAVLSSATVDLTQSDLPLTASGQLTISDIDSAQAFVANTIKGQYGSLTIDPAGKWAYQANSAHPEFAQDQNYNEIFTVKAIDGTATSVAINITGTNDAAVLSSATVDLTQSDLPLTASGQLTISDIDSAQAFVANTIKGQYGSLTIDFKRTQPQPFQIKTATRSLRSKQSMAPPLA